MRRCSLSRSPAGPDCGIMDGVDVEDALYADPPEQFVPGRAAAAEAAKAAGDDKRARAIAALRKPTVGAWVVNLIALKRPDLIDSLTSLASSLRTAQQELKGDQLRKLASERRTLVSALVEQAQALATSVLPGVRIPLTEVESTFNAALADETVAHSIRTGRLLKTTTYTGFGSLPGSTQSGGDSATLDGTAPLDDDPATQRRLAQARAAELAAHAELDRTTVTEKLAAAHVEQLEETMAGLRQELADAKADLSRSREAHRFAQRRLAAASRSLNEAETGVDT